MLLHPSTSTASSAAVPPVHSTLLSLAITDPWVKARLFLAAALTPYHRIKYLDPKKKEHLAVEATIREGLKLGTQNHYLDGIPSLFAAAERLEDAKLNDGRFSVPSERVAIGMLTCTSDLVHRISTDLIQQITRIALARKSHP